MAGLTGGIACGKSTVARMFAELGAAVVSADEISREIVAPGMPAWEEIRAEFGDAVLRPDGTLDRKRLGTIVFSDPAKRRRLEAITHPRIRQVMAERIAAAAAAGRPVIAEIPLLFESEASRSLVDVVIVVYADPETQLARLMGRDQLTREQALARIEAQMPLSEKVKRADFVIDNGGDLERTREQVARIWSELLQA
ncbi:MAG: dephospho-CoA kinase [Bacillota bacterium]